MKTHAHTSHTCIHTGTHATHTCTSHTTHTHCTRELHPHTPHFPFFLAPLCPFPGPGFPGPCLLPRAPFENASTESRRTLQGPFSSETSLGTQHSTGRIEALWPRAAFAENLSNDPGSAACPHGERLLSTACRVLASPGECPALPHGRTGAAAFLPRASA